MGWGSIEGSVYVRTFSYRFLPHEVHDKLRVKVVYGTMETPGGVLGDLESFELTKPIQEQANINEVSL